MCQKSGSKNATLFLFTLYTHQGKNKIGVGLSALYGFTIHTWWSFMLTSLITSGTYKPQHEINMNDNMNEAQRLNMYSRPRTNQINCVEG